MSHNETSVDAGRPALETPERCRREACPRPAEPEEPYCAECGLERSLFHRERRPGAGSAPAEAGYGRRS